MWLFLGCFPAGLLLRGSFKLRGTTLRAACHWALFSIVSITLAEAALPLATDGREPAGQTLLPQALRFVAAMTTFCPLMAVLGAKRPQHRGWQVIVLSLLGLLWMPSLQSLLFFSGDALYVPAAWSWLMFILLALGLVNYLPTRFAPSCLLAVGGQWLLMAGHLPLFSVELPAWSRMAAPLCFGVAALFITCGLPRRRMRHGAFDAGLDRVWLDFRDAFGTAWALRVSQRLNETTTVCRWPLVLTWDGFRPAADKQQPESLVLSAQLRAEVGKALRTVLRRFVSPDWFADRLDRA